MKGRRETAVEKEEQREKCYSAFITRVTGKSKQNHSKICFFLSKDFHAFHDEIELAIEIFEYISIGVKT